MEKPFVNVLQFVQRLLPFVTIGIVGWAYSAMSALCDERLLSVVPQHQNLSYRPDIAGLRAIAVISVLASMHSQASPQPVSSMSISSSRFQDF
jgi:hypothetical protein